MFDTCFLGVAELAELIAGRVVSPSDLLEAQLARIARVGPVLNAVATLDVNGARRTALEAGSLVAHGEVLGPLHGIGITLKDSHAVKGLRSTIGVREPGDRIPDRDGTVAARLRAAGAIIVGKTNLASWLYDIQTVSELFGRTNNPWDPPGRRAARPAGPLRSSRQACRRSKSGVTSVARSGSRQPSAASSASSPLKGGSLKPVTWTSAGLEATGSWNLISPLARSVRDVRLVYSVLAGPDGVDPTVPPVPVASHPPVTLSRLRIAVAPSFPGFEGPWVQHAVRETVLRVARRLSQEGAIVAEALPDVDWEEQRAVRSRLYRQAHQAFSSDRTAAPFSLDDHFADLDLRSRFIASWETFFREWDVLLCPATN